MKSDIIHVHEHSHTPIVDIIYMPVKCLSEQRYIALDHLHVQ